MIVAAAVATKDRKDSNTTTKYCEVYRTEQNSIRL